MLSQWPAIFRFLCVQADLLLEHFGSGSEARLNWASRYRTISHILIYVALCATFAYNSHLFDRLMGDKWDLDGSSRMSRLGPVLNWFCAWLIVWNIVMGL